MVKRPEIGSTIVMDGVSYTVVSTWRKLSKYSKGGSGDTKVLGWGMGLKKKAPILLPMVDGSFMKLDRVCVCSGSTDVEPVWCHTCQRLWPR